jgi:nucleoside-diphosphate-sugar epimerase
MSTISLLILGLGYSALQVLEELHTQGIEFQAIATKRDPSSIEGNCKAEVVKFSNDFTIPKTITHILITTPPNAEGDPAYNIFHEQIRKLPNLKWLGYLSATNVYGDHQGAWVDETTPTAPISEHAKNRQEAEQQWQTFAVAHIFRLGGIYGPGRSIIDTIKQGKDQPINKPGQYFSRIHVEDIAGIIITSMLNPTFPGIYNVVDDEPTNQLELYAYAYRKLGLPLKPAIDHDKADLSPMMRSFYQDNKRVNNDKVKQVYNYGLRYPDYRKGLDSLIIE